MRYAGMFLLWLLLFGCFTPIFVIAIGAPTIFVFGDGIVARVGFWLSYVCSGLAAAWVVKKAFPGKAKPTAAVEVAAVEVAVEEPIPPAPVRAASDNPYESPRSYFGADLATEDYPETSSKPTGVGDVLLFAGAVTSVIAMIYGVILAFDLSIQVGRSDLSRIIQLLVSFLLMVGGYFGLRFARNRFRRNSR